MERAKPQRRLARTKAIAFRRSTRTGDNSHRLSWRLRAAHLEEDDGRVQISFLLFLLRTKFGIFKWNRELSWNSFGKGYVTTMLLVIFPGTSLLLLLVVDVTGQNLFL